MRIPDNVLAINQKIIKALQYALDNYKPQKFTIRFAKAIIAGLDEPDKYTVLVRRETDYNSSAHKQYRIIVEHKKKMAGWLGGVLVGFVIRTDPEAVTVDTWGPWREQIQKYIHVKNNMTRWQRDQIINANRKQLQKYERAIAALHRKIAAIKEEATHFVEHLEPPEYQPLKFTPGPRADDHDLCEEYPLTFGYYR